MKILNLLVSQFKDKHGKMPTEIVIHPVAMAALALRQSVAPVWNGIKVTCHDIESGPYPTLPERLGITVVDGALRGLDLP